MPKRTIDLRPGEPLLDIASYARRGPGGRDRLSPAEIEQIERTVRRVPEVMVKVLSRGGQDLKSVQRHLDYIGRRGEVELETDDGERLTGRGTGKELLEDWDLDLDSQRRRPELGATEGRSPPKLVHKLMFSMPAGTPPAKVLAAVRNFAREEFALKHRYAMVLHTDEPHPHVHLVMKALSEQGARLHIRKATLRNWRREFAHHLRALGVDANATERAVRGQQFTHAPDGLYRAQLRGATMSLVPRRVALSEKRLTAIENVVAKQTKAARTRALVERAWGGVADLLASQGHAQLSAAAREFPAKMTPLAPAHDDRFQYMQAIALRRDTPIR